ncbi:MAG: serine/threonine protein kinase [Edafosvirus sp.]|uniref:Serine/threonine protein kinase n=1 Tax=Edafosvirus sp. TaxID=2487765 RepID=A0A3G4ZXF9_9VIRU|nr:MAG: serine/threonine protein kinase [Edafosvirus sp.]
MASKTSISSSNKSLHSLGSLKDKEHDTIPFRIEFIKELLEGKKLKPLIDFDNSETENFMNSKANDDDSDDSYNSNDTRKILNKKIYNFNNLINQIGGQLLYIKSGTTGHTFQGIIKDKDTNKMFNYAVKVVAYPKKKYGDIYNVERPENAELMMIRLLSYFVVKRQTPHIVLPIGTFNTSIKPFTTLIEEDSIDGNIKKYKEFVEMQKAGNYHDQVSILISEWANRGDLLDFIRKNYSQFKLLHWKVIFFQIISVLAVIQSKWPQFRHNDLKANNILVHKIEKKKKKNSKKNSEFTYRVVRCTYYVPNIGYIIKLWDFDFACINGIIDNAKVNSKWTKEINVTPEQNRYYDMHYFFNTLIKRGFFPEFLTDNIVPKEAKDFVNRIVPPKYQSGNYVHKRGRILINDEYLTPDEVLKTDPFFEDFRKSSKNKYKNKTPNGQNIVSSGGLAKEKEKKNIQKKFDNYDFILGLGNDST